MSDERDQLNTYQLPPRLPQSVEELELTIKLLGNRKRAELGIPTQNKLKRLIGVYPTCKEAALWKRILRRVCREQFENVR